MFIFAPVTPVLQFDNTDDDDDGGGGSGDDNYC